MIPATPDAGDLPGESVTTNYDATYGLPSSLESGWSAVGTYVSSQTYTGYGEPTVTQLKIAQECITLAVARMAEARGR